MPKINLNKDYIRYLEDNNYFQKSYEELTEERIQALNDYFGVNSAAGEVRLKCPIHDGGDKNFAYNTRNGYYYCHSQCGRGAGPHTLYKALNLGDHYE